MKRYWSLFWLQVRTSLVTGMQYRWEFIVDGAMSIFWAAMALLPLWVLGAQRQELAGWRYPEMVVVVGWFTILKGLLDGAVNPSLLAVVDHIRQGTLDFVLIKPADAQFLVSTAKFDPWKMVDAPAGVGVIAYGFVLLGRAPSVVHVLAALGCLVAAAFVLYALWLLVVSAAFWVVRLDNLAFLFMSIFDFARWPVSIFRGVLRALFTFIIPLALMTTFPSLAVLGKLSPTLAGGAFLGAAIFMMLARVVWNFAIRRYTSASS